jgi:4-alpha-glucanotransferase
LRDRLGLLQQSAAEELATHRKSVNAVLEVARERGLLPDGEATEQQQIEALHLLLAQTPSVLLGVALVDGIGDRRVQNQPGTTAEQYPNWQVPLADSAGQPVLLEDLEADPRFNGLLAAVENALRQSDASGPR